LLINWNRRGLGRAGYHLALSNDPRETARFSAPWRTHQPLTFVEVGRELCSVNLLRF
jgi:hypothetical protein